MLFWTHRYDLLFKVIGLAVLIWAWLALGLAPPHDPTQSQEVTSFSLLMALLVAGWVMVWRPLFRPLATWAYVARTFSVRLSWRQSHTLAPLFSLGTDNGLKWYPCLDVLELEPARRLDALLERAAQVQASKKEGYFARTRKSSALGRLLHPQTHIAWTVVSAAGAVPILLGSLFQVGPAAGLVRLTAFPDGHYYPTLTFLLGLLFWSLTIWFVCYGFDRLVRTEED
jgi:hypothetical protein